MDDNCICKVSCGLLVSVQFPGSSWACVLSSHPTLSSSASSYQQTHTWTGNLVSHITPVFGADVLQVSVPAYLSFIGFIVVRMLRSGRYRLRVSTAGSSSSWKLRWCSRFSSRNSSSSSSELMTDDCLPTGCQQSLTCVKDSDRKRYGDDRWAVHVSCL